MTNEVVRVRRSVGRAKGGQEIKAPKSAAGVREVTIPSNIVAALEAHLEAYAAPGRAGWLFPAAGAGDGRAAGGAVSARH